MGFTPGTAAARGTTTAYMEETRVLDTQFVRTLMKRMTMMTNTVGLRPPMMGSMVWVIQAVTPQLSRPKM